ncbi:MAG: HlyD family efflux transporter periplasmic adaptor subunit, partial [Deltaproteobacteria bacterium]|nr:HlyD family efflux transporter periplasmic adaptor subunit [Deltaproteobacteria bacterium]
MLEINWVRPHLVSILPCLCLVLAMVSGCRPDQSQSWQGYVEGEYVYVAAPKGGKLLSRPLSRGQEVIAGTLAFALDDVFELAAVDAARQELEQSRSTLADMRKGARPSERETIQARLDKAKAEAELARLEYDRRIDLLDDGTIAREDLDKKKSLYETASQQVRQIEAELRTSALGSRIDAIRAAEAQVRAAEAGLAQAIWNLDQRTQNASVSGLVFDTFFNPGDWVPAGRPVLAILPPGLRKVRFFVPEPLLGSIRPGQTVRVTWDGQSEPLACTVSYVSTRVEYTPPVIYSSQSRAKLVFMV